MFSRVILLAQSVIKFKIKTLSRGCQFFLLIMLKFLFVFILLQAVEAGFFELDDSGEKITQEGLVNTIVASKHVAKALETVKPIDYTAQLERALDLLVGVLVCLVLLVLLSTYEVVRRKFSAAVTKRATTVNK